MRLFELEDNDTFSPEQVALIKKNCQPFLQQCNQRFLYRGIHSLKTNNEFIKFDVRQNRSPTGSSRILHELYIKAFNKLGFVANRNNSIFCSGSLDLADVYGNVYIVFPIGPFQFTWSPNTEDLLHSASLYKEYFENEAVFTLNYRDKTYLELLEQFFKTYDFNIIDKTVTNNHAQFKTDSIDNPKLDDTEIAKYFYNTGGKTFGRDNNASVLKITNYTEENILEFIKKLNYTDKDLPAAIESGNEIMIQCKDYYAVEYTTNNYELLWDVYK